MDAKRDVKTDAKLDPASETARLRRLRGLLDKGRGGTNQLSDAELLELMRLYRYATSRVAWHETRRANLALLEEARTLARAAHGFLYRGIDRPREGWLARSLYFFGTEVPQAVRGEWRVFLASSVLVYGLALISFFAVRQDLELAYSLLDPGVVANEIEQLEATRAGEPFRGNFTFGIGESPTTSAWIMTHNMGVGVFFFGSGIVPPIFLYLLSVNGLMLGTYTAVASHWDQGLAISSILWCHGVLELTALVLAGAAGLVLLRAWVAPGPWSRGHAMARESRRAWRLMAAVFPMLFCAGIIEGFLSPHLPLAGRLAIAVASFVALVGWFGFCGRVPRVTRT